MFLGMREKMLTGGISDEQERFCQDEELFHLSSREKTNFPLRRTFMYFYQEELTLRVCSKTFCGDAHINPRSYDLLTFQRWWTWKKSLFTRSIYLDLTY